MNKTTKIILISTGVLAVGTLIYFVIRRMNKKPEVKTMEDRMKKIKSSKTPISTGSTSKPTNTNSSSTNTPIDKMPIKPVGLITSSNTPVFVSTLSSSTNPTTVVAEPDFTTTSFKRLDDKIKKLYYILAVVDKNAQGTIIYVPAQDFTPEKPNQPVGDTMKNTLWRTVFNDWSAINKGFNEDEKNQATKNYGNQLLNVFKTQRLDYLFDPKIYNINQAWYKDAEERSIKANVKTDFWKSN
jgi:hypothetical protein